MLSDRSPVAHGNAHARVGDGVHGVGNAGAFAAEQQRVVGAECEIVVRVSPCVESSDEAARLGCAAAMKVSKLS